MFKNISRDKWLLVWVIIGFFIIMFDQNISLGRINPYPSYKTDDGYSLEFQVYSLNYMYGAGCETSDVDGMFMGDVYYQLTFDVVPDLLGFLILAVFLKKMAKFSRLFSIASVMSWFGVGLYLFIHLMPFFLNGMALTYMSFWLAIAMYGTEVITGYVFICGICDTLSGFEHRTARRSISIAWFGTAVLSAVLCVLRWISIISPALLVTYEILLIGVSALYYYFIMRESDFIVREKVIGEQEDL